MRRSRSRSRRSFLLLFCGLLAAPAAAQVALVDAFPHLAAFDRPVDVQHPPDGSGRLYVVQQAGLVVSFPNDPGVHSVDQFLDLRARVNTEPSWEEGLLGLAFHPDYADNGYFYVHYTTFPEEGGLHRTIIARFTREAAEPPAADPGSELVLFELEQPFRWHNGGQLAFGPPEGPAGERYLYLSLGDGGEVGDPLELAQDRTSLFGSILRLDVDHPAPGLAYGIPPGNPFVGNEEGWREEIFAYGLRNPWRFSIDPVTGWLWVGDVGQNTWEEVSVVTAPGANLGWDVMEGETCYEAPDPGEPLCDDPGFTAPVWVYPRPEGFSVTGGYVYRGSAIPELYGKYVFGDFVTGRYWALDYDGEEAVVDLLGQATNVASFGLDAAGELYLASFDGRIYRFVRRPIATEPPAAPGAVALRLRGPNPFRDATAFEVEAERPGPARVVAYDVLGREVAMLFEGTLQPGQPRRVAFDAGALPAGVYVVRLTAGGRAVAQRVVRAR